MKRRTRLIIIGCATLGGTLATTVTAAAQAASATPSVQDIARVLKPAHTTPAPTAVHPPVHRSVPAPLPRVAVKPGDSLSAIGARISRTWVQLAGYNHISNPDLIYPGQVLIVPPATYAPPAVSTPSPAVTHRSSTTSSSTSSGSSHRTYAAASPSGSSSGVWGCIAAHESGGNPATNTGNGYYGMYQDTQSSWVAAGGLAYAPRADLASGAAQTAVNQRIQSQQGWSAWPSTSRMCGA
jgi:resuscitation-promoting factor RpfA